MNFLTFLQSSFKSTNPEQIGSKSILWNLNARASSWPLSIIKKSIVITGDLVTWRLKFHEVICEVANTHCNYSSMGEYFLCRELQIIITKRLKIEIRFTDFKNNLVKLWPQSDEAAAPFGNGKVFILIA